MFYQVSKIFLHFKLLPKLAEAFEEALKFVENWEGNAPATYKAFVKSTRPGMSYKVRLPGKSIMSRITRLPLRNKPEQKKKQRKLQRNGWPRRTPHAKPTKPQRESRSKKSQYTKLTSPRIEKLMQSQNNRWVKKQREPHMKLREPVSLHGRHNRRNASTNHRRE